jgi:hypothetical protein
VWQSVINLGLEAMLLLQLVAGAYDWIPVAVVVVVTRNWYY